MVTDMERISDLYYVCINALIWLFILLNRMLILYGSLFNNGYYEITYVGEVVVCH